MRARRLPVTLTVSRGRLAAGALTLLAIGGALGAAAASSPAVRNAWSAAGVSSSVAFSYELPNLPGQRITGVLVEYEPGAGTPAHHHTKDGSVVGYVLDGAVRSKVDDGSVEVHRAGDSWLEPPGAAHSVSENASSTETARYLAIFVAKDGAKLTTMDP